MSEKWYYVSEGERKGPISQDQLLGLVRGGSLQDQDYIWRKGFSDWTQVKDVPEVSVQTQEVSAPRIAEPINYYLRELAGDGNKVFIKIGADRGANEVEYGPYSLDLMQKLFNGKRVNAKTFAFIQGMHDWIMLADFLDFEEVFNDVPPPIEEKERRQNSRKPFVARMYIQNNKEVFLGVCRDISIGGMQVLVDHFPGKNGDKISINVHPENSDYHFVAAGEVVRILDGGHGFSFRFNELSEDSKYAIEKYISNG